MGVCVCVYLFHEPGTPALVVWGRDCCLRLAAVGRANRTDTQKKKVSRDVHMALLRLQRARAPHVHTRPPKLVRSLQQIMAKWRWLSGALFPPPPPPPHLFFFVFARPWKNVHTPCCAPVGFLAVGRGAAAGELAAHLVVAPA